MAKDNGFAKNIFWILLNVFLLVAVVFGGKMIFLSDFFTPQRTVTVSADGRAVLAPDIADISFSVVSEGKDPAAIQTVNTKKINDAIEFVKSQGVDAKDIKTTNYSLVPQYDYSKREIYPPPPSQIIGYVLTQSVLVKVRDIEKTAAILGGLTSRGINQIEQVSFRVDDPDKFLTSARDEAFAEARAKAEAMARANKAKIRRVVTFGESSGGYPIFYSKEAFGRGGEDASVAPAPVLEPGSQEVTVQVSVTYELW